MKQNMKGQVIVEFTLIVPFLIIFMILGADLGRFGITKHRVMAASYEGLKVVSQAEDPFFEPCMTSEEINQKIAESQKAILNYLNSHRPKGSASIKNLPDAIQRELDDLQNRQTLCEFVENRTKQALENMGFDASKIILMKGASVKNLRPDAMGDKIYVSFFLDPILQKVHAGDAIHAGVEIAYVFQYLPGRAMGFSHAVKQVVKSSTFYRFEPELISAEYRSRCLLFMDRFHRPLVPSGHSGQGMDQIIDSCQ